MPRDSGAGWDFEDVRDHYLQELFKVDAVRLRSFDMPRYLELSRVVTGEVMHAVYSEWRSSFSRCAGGLVWFFKDLWPGAGWGIVDSRGFPKAAYYYLRRAWQPRQVTITDEGLDGLHRGYFLSANLTREFGRRHEDQFFGLVSGCGGGARGADLGGDSSGGRCGDEAAAAQKVAAIAIEDELSKQVFH